MQTHAGAGEGARWLGGARATPTSKGTDKEPAKTPPAVSRRPTIFRLGPQKAATPVYDPPPYLAVVILQRSGDKAAWAKVWQQQIGGGSQAGMVTLDVCIIQHSISSMTRWHVKQPARDKEQRQTRTNTKGSVNVQTFRPGRAPISTRSNEVRIGLTWNNADPTNQVSTLRIDYVPGGHQFHRDG